MSAPAIYRHYDDKEDLLFAVALQGHELFGRYLARGLKGDTPRERLILTGVGYLDFALEHRAFYLIMFSAPPEHLGYEKLDQKSRDEGTVTFQMLVDRVRECMEAGVLAEGDPVAVSIQIWALVHGLVTLFLRMPSDPEEPSRGAPAPVASVEAFRTLYRHAIEALLDGLAVAR